MQAAAALLPLQKECFSEYAKFAGTNRWIELLAKHNDQANPYNLTLYDYVVIGSDVQPAYGILQIKLSSLWMLLNYLRALKAGWSIQLNGDGTSDFCRNAVDLVTLTVTSILHQTVCLRYSATGRE